MQLKMIKNPFSSLLANCCFMVSLFVCFKTVWAGNGNQIVLIEKIVATDKSTSWQEKLIYAKNEEGPMVSYIKTA